ncbi:hypothetical protein WA026_011413 [Henosepilachna vigintioctopunctata]|uniref:G-protein coupled receptors family 1 profile domain-containing protein n=1 Tax=Henosepilachna vigintioctopunctata TaxID=420089 RepID=A0AAW1TTK4_9CUCU
MCSRREDSYLIIILFSFMDTFLDLPDILNGVVQSLKVEAYVIEMLSGCVGAALHDFYKTIAVVVTFFICWAPFHAQRLLAIYGERSSSKMIKAYLTLTYISGVLYYLSTTVNPLLYNIMSHKFREAFKNTFRQCFRRHLVVMDPGGGRCYATLSGRSSQVNSHSNTDSYSKQSSLRYLDAEMARVYDSRRPLVVSFRRKATQASPRRSARISKNEQSAGGELPKVQEPGVNGDLKNDREQKLLDYVSAGRTQNKTTGKENKTNVQVA